MPHRPRVVQDVLENVAAKDRVRPLCCELVDKLRIGDIGSPKASSRVPTRCGSNRMGVDIDADIVGTSRNRFVV